MIISSILGGFVSFALLIMWLTAVSNFLFFPKLKPKTPPLNSQPLVSILIPARNEAHTIGQTVQSILAQTYGSFHLIILDDQSDDGTAEVVKQAAGGDERVKVINGRSLPTGWLGKNWACHQLSQHANGSLLLFVDADVQLAPSALASLVDQQTATEADLLTIWPTQRTETWAERLVVPQLALAILAYLPILPVHYTHLIIFSAANGQCLLFTADGYTQCGGHASIKDNVVEDVALARQIKQNKRRLRMADGNRLVNCRMYQNWSEVRDGFAKNLLAGHGNSLPFLAVSTLFHWLIFIFPALWLLFGGGWWAVGLLLAGMGLRLATAVFTHQRPLDALLMPLSVILMTRIAVQSVRWHLRGEAIWKGRRVG